MEFLKVRDPLREEKKKKKKKKNTKEKRKKKAHSENKGDASLSPVSDEFIWRDRKKREEEGAVVASPVG